MISTKIGPCNMKRTFQKKKKKKFVGKLLVILLRTLITGTCVSVLTSTHSLCFGSKIKKIRYTLQTPVVLLYKSGCKGKYISRIYFLEVCINESNQFCIVLSQIYHRFKTSKYTVMFFLSSAKIMYMCIRCLIISNA